MPATAPLGGGTGNAGNPPSGAISAWFVVPEGSAGEITNRLSQIADDFRPSGNPLTDADQIAHLVGTVGLGGLATTSAQSVQGTTAWTVVHVTSAVQEQALEAAGADGPYTSQAQAQAEANGKTQAKNPNNQPLGNLFSLDVSGISSWFFRWLMVAGGAFLIALGISRLTGADNAITSAARKIPVIPL